METGYPVRGNNLLGIFMSINNKLAVNKSLNFYKIKDWVEL